MNSTGRRSRNVRRSARRVQPVVVVRPAQQAGRRRNRRRNVRRRANPLSGPAGRTEVFTFTVDNLKANSSGTIKFGPDLSACPALSGGILKSYHDYKITALTVVYKSFASSTTSGAISIELDNSCTQSTLGSYVNSFTVSKTGTKKFSASQINGTKFISSTVNQFYLLYKGSSSSTDTAGQFVITIRVVNQNPK